MKIYTTAKDPSSAVNQVINANTTDIKIATKLKILTMKRPLRPAEVLERAKPLQVPQVPDR